MEMHACDFKPMTGTVYHKLSGADYVCLGYENNLIHLMNITNGREIIVLGAVQFENGWIDWDWEKSVSLNKKLLKILKEEGVI